MFYYFVRVQFISEKPASYKALKMQLRALGFNKIIIGKSSGKGYVLPKGNYSITTLTNINDVLHVVTATASAIEINPYVLITQVNDYAMSGLDPA